MLPIREVNYVATVPSGITAFLVGDIGGTNCNFGIFSLAQGQEQLLLSLHFKSQQITDFAAAIQQALDLCANKYKISIKVACLAAAGIVSPERDSVKPTNLNITIEAKDIIKKTSLQRVFLTNDFEIIGYGIARLKPDSIVQVKSGKSSPKMNQVVLGAGTGLGKSILLWEPTLNAYAPVASEGGHADFPAQSALEYELVAYIKQLKEQPCNVSWEDVLSGDGIKRIYSFFLHRNLACKPNEMLAQSGLQPDEIFNARNLDEHAFNTYELYAKFYARCAKNFALDALARGGVYIAGGIAAKSVELFKQPLFLDEFMSCGKQEALLLEIPIYVIADYNVSLYGAMEYMRQEGLCG